MHRESSSGSSNPMHESDPGSPLGNDPVVTFDIYLKDGKLDKRSSLEQARRSLIEPRRAAKGLARLLKAETDCCKVIAESR